MNKFLIYFNLVLTLCLIGVFSWFFFSQKPANQIPLSVETVSSGDTYIDSCGKECKKEIEKIVSLSLASISGETKEIVKIVNTTTVPTTDKKQYAYIPLSGPITTTSTDWTDVPGTDFYLNLNTDYGKDSYVLWEPTLKVAHGNGVVFARIYDVTNKIAVNGSEVFVSNESDLTQVTSGALTFWAGNNLYRVQIKSLNTFEVTFGSGRVKIEY